MSNSNLESEEQISTPHPHVTANHVAMTVNGHDGSQTVNGEHPSVNGDANGDVEVRCTVLCCHSCAVNCRVKLCLLCQEIMIYFKNIHC